MSAKKSPACGACRWFRPRYEESTEGRCCRHPPRVVADMKDGPDTCWPLVDIDEFCGEWASKSTKAKEVTK